MRGKLKKEETRGMRFELTYEVVRHLPLDRNYIKFEQNYGWMLFSLKPGPLKQTIISPI